jgi:hypothetical protein
VTFWGYGVFPSRTGHRAERDFHFRRATSDILVSVLSNAIEVGIPLSYFTGPFDSLPYYPGHDFATDSQSGAAAVADLWLFGCRRRHYGPDRLGAVTLAAVPEPLTLSVFAAGLIGAVAFRRRRKTAIA